MSRTRNAGAAAVAALLAAIVTILPMGAALPKGALSLPQIGVGRSVPSRNAVEVPAVVNDADEAVLGRPLALAVDAGRLYIADAMDCAVKIFTKDGGFLRSVGRKGAGPGDCSPAWLAGDSDRRRRQAQLPDPDIRRRERCAAPSRSLSPGQGLRTEERPLSRLTPGRRPGNGSSMSSDTAGRPIWEGLTRAPPPARSPTRSAT
jgi:hypothetical protein